mgnify:CR=1 FL=1
MIEAPLHTQGNPKGEEMSTLGDDLIQSMTEALAHAKSEGPAVVHPPNPQGKGVNSAKRPPTDYNSCPDPRSR